MKYLLVKGDTEVRNDNSYVLLYCRGEDGKKYEIPYRFDPYFYTDKTSLKHELITRFIPNDKKDIFGKFVSKVVVKTPNDVPHVKRLSPMNYEADVHFPQRFRYDYGIKSCFTIEDNQIYCSDNPGIYPHCMCVDIETLDDVDAEEAESPILSVAMKDEVKNKYIIFVTTDKEVNMEKVQKYISDHLSSYKNYKPLDLTIKTYSNETLMFIKMNKFLSEVAQPDVLYGWNYTEFDHKYMVNRVGDVLDLRPYMAYDLMLGYQNLTENELVSSKLDDIAIAELSIGKLPRTTIAELYENDIEKLIAYNVIDVYITSEINSKVEVIKFHQSLAELAGTDLEGTKYNSNIVDSFLLHFVGGKIVLPSKGMLTSSSIEEGGRVAKASTGIRKNIAVVDLTRAYPTTIQRNNLSPETKLGNACEVCEYGKSCEEKYQYIDGEEINDNHKKGCDKFLCHIPHYKMPSGRCYRTDKVGLVPAVFIQLINHRKGIQKKMKEAIAAGDKVTEKKYYEMQRAIKYLMNSFYGVLGSIDKEGKGKFRLADGEIGSDVTESIRLLNKWIENHLNNISLLRKYTNPGIEGILFDLLFNMNEKVKCIYGDTDSCVFEFPGEDNFEDKEHMLTSIGLITNLLNKSFVDFSNELSGPGENLYQIEFEKLYSVFFQGGVKKRYAGLYAWKKGVWVDNRSFDERKDIKGYEVRRSDWSKFSREHQEKLFEIVLTRTDKKEVSLAIQSWKSEFFSGSCDVIMKIPKGIKKTKYEKNMPIQVRAAAYSNKYLDKHFKLPTKVFYCFMKKMKYKNAPDYDVIAVEIDDNPSDYGEIDYEEMYEKQFKAPLARITDTIWGEESWAELETGAFQDTLEEFF